ncbi:venom allergen 5-like [Macrosteles quadrilineatus]|uniref:venom allergen 5-like n=1 Tax=Macrosteles quadrilineatus TaxID=74068 RepID=UPI0023E0DFE9|nr:venom allergen 5-like [Macrosteles quadrilineatus]
MINHVVFSIMCISQALCFDYCSISCDGTPHTMCSYADGGPSNCSGFTHGLTKNQKTYLVQLHNELRELVATGKTLPPAANMMKMIWSEEAAMIAQRWADQCTTGEHTDSCRSLTSGEKGGQIITSVAKFRTDDTYNFIRQTVMRWFTSNETVFDAKTIGSYQYDNRSFAFAQMVWAKSDRLGCGFAHGVLKERVEHRFVCNYYPGAVEGESVYLVGKPCTKCPFVRCSHDFKSLCEHQSGTVWNRNQPNRGRVRDSDEVVVFVLVAFSFAWVFRL